MEAILGMLVTGLVVGSLARLAVPGPDPMPIWLTVAIGVAGSFVGGAAVAGITGTGDILLVLLGSVVTGSLLVIAYRRVIQRRGITGPGAHEHPGRALARRRRAEASGDVGERLRTLAELRDSGMISEEEFQAKRRDLLAEL